MFEIDETVEEQPRAKAILFANESPFVNQSTPHRCNTIARHPHGDDAGSRVPTPEPFVFVACARQRSGRLGFGVEIAQATQHRYAPRDHPHDGQCCDAAQHDTRHNAEPLGGDT